jgi:hypothetical protein
VGAYIAIIQPALQGSDELTRARAEEIRTRRAMDCRKDDPERRAISSVSGLTTRSTSNSTNAQVMTLSPKSEKATVAVYAATNDIETVVRREVERSLECSARFPGSGVHSRLTFR